MEDRDIYRVFEQVKPTRSQEEAMLERLFLEERKKRPMKLMKKTIAVLAAAALLLTTCAFAAVTGLGRQVLDYFGVLPRSGSRWDCPTPSKTGGPLT